ncbi:MAG TPA: alpha/beta fold hydrolase [Anaerolineae bacterium]|nr:alpha/beta fold hydrolase [Anaerolineae bacterium]
MSLNVLVTGDGPAMLLLHGFTGSARSWGDHLEAWSLGHRVIAPDLLGHGGSEAPTDPTRYALERQADDLAGLLRLLDVGRADIVGYSMGARLALVMALAHPGLVGCLVLESPSAGIVDPVARSARRQADERLARILERDGIEAFVAGWEAQPLFASHAALPADRQRQLRSERLGHDPLALAASLRGAGQGVMAPLHDRLPGIAAPTLVIAGALDTAGVERARNVAAGIPRARLEVVAGVGHTPHLEAPGPFFLLATHHLRQPAT